MNAVTRLISPPQARGLQASATTKGIFTILAIDHRDSLREMTNPAVPAAVSAEMLTEIKLAVLKELAPLASGVLLDPDYGAAQAIAAGALPGHVGLLCPLEVEGVFGDPLERQTMLMEGWNAEKAKRLGATGVKLLIFYHPDSPAAEVQEELLYGVVSECERAEIPLFVEPISYSLDPAIPKESIEFARERRRIVVDSVKRLGALKPNVLKVEFPVDVRYETERAVWAEACAELDEAAAVPWALLSAGEPFDIFREQVCVACENGCSGFLAGRAVWREVATLSGGARREFLETTARERLRTLVEIAEEHGTAWSARYTIARPDENWYRGF